MAGNDTDPSIKDLIEYRKEHFAVRCSKSRYAFEKSYDLMVTHNGSQWSGMNLTKEEIPKVIMVLKTVLHDG